ncbi:hypothetical protein QPK31_03935 [Massilia sp. YIM B02769]|uniref:hypothetical protein n=1 Tax=Massilia sp. YIM B02769 TaxID=3050129 RepID=UPI0025B69C45|nr:hypothetical protein [Massilia sp. YIM B02769]MDN4057373.1 hypothetical protein [Massilia sp. YIM B02769]
MELKTAGEWSLSSGVWELDMDRPGLELKRTALGYPVSSRLSREVLGALMQASALPRDGSLHFPPEFRFSPLSGEQLRGARPADKDEAWVAPHGAAPHTGQSGRVLAGLRQSARPLALARARRHDPEAEPDAALPLPPPGDYEFFSASFGSLDAVLLALDPRKGTLFGWVAGVDEWVELENGKPLLLSETALPRGAWRAELAHGFHSRLYLPTERGLACVTPDIAALVYEVDYAGDGPAVGAPVGFDGRVWAPCREAGKLVFIGVDPAGGAALRLALPAGIEPGEISAPVSQGRVAFWPCAGGQLRLHKQVSGEVLAAFLPWPAGIAPQFQFGSPYLALDGALWQICFDNASQQYTYLKLGTDGVEQAPASSPRLCSGSYTYRFSTRFTDEPWNDPEQGDDSTPSEVIVPLVESPATKSAIGLRIESHEALETLLASNEKLRAELVVDDASATTGFHTIAVAQPWRLRLFRHGGRLWAYHPLLKSIAGWDLA